MIPLSLYIHIPWCIRKCPYCDFNSHKIVGPLPEGLYIDALINDLKQDVSCLGKRVINSIFIGGGTPSLISAKGYARLFDEIQNSLDFVSNIEITLEANPGTTEHGLFRDYLSVGINRLSLGIQSFNSSHLKKLGRIHGSAEASQAIISARKAGFDNINIDIMHGLPDQTKEEAISDLEMALSFQPEHLSWYQLTIEPNTVFYKINPRLPEDEITISIEQAGFEILANARYSRYEISAFCKNDKYSRHNLNYWLFGDYLGIGAGAHGKLSFPDLQKIYRTRKYRQPKDYLNNTKALAEKTFLSKEDLIFEFMLNVTRLDQGIPRSLFTSRTLLPYNEITDLLDKSAKKGLIKLSENGWQVTDLGRKFTNNLQEIFLIDKA
ncbi:MAG: YggW family oxidoreductase [Legionellales bacterium RIFCSPHIGHO2_12_FULL_42_9]|nr:MAG: YggW family oxidoreductase [Legionellales bacterium RIFCSPHIGHO2_12_FULL_42_9]